MANPCAEQAALAVLQRPADLGSVYLLGYRIPS